MLHLCLASSVARKIERFMQDFLRSRVGEEKKDNLISWDLVNKPKEEGDLVLIIWCPRKFRL